MERKKDDLRIQRTHKLLSDAMFSLLETRSFDEISVVDICNKATVHRATFYKHFKDKYDFMEYVTKEKLRELYDSSISDNSFSEPRGMYRDMIEKVIRFVEDNKTMLSLSAKATENGFFDSMHKIVFKELSAFISEFDLRKRTRDVPVDILAQFLTGGFIALVRMWLYGDSGYTKEQMAEYIENMLANGERGKS